MFDWILRADPLSAFLSAVLVLGLLVALYLVYAIVNAILAKRNEQSAREFERVQEEYERGAQEAVEMMPQRPLSEDERLKQKEEELSLREKRFKDSKLKELEEREKRLSETSQKPPLEQEDGFGSDEMLKEKKRLAGFISIAKERYGRGELSERNFKRIVSDYQQQLDEVDARIRKTNGGRA